VNELLTYVIMLFAYSSVSTICDNPDGITKSAKAGAKVCVCVCSKTTPVLSE